jgi:multidrug efflux pump subunit AcrB
MLQLVKIALSKPLTFAVMAILIVLGGTLSWITTPTDIFPNIGVPVVAAVWSYNGLSPREMSGRVIYYYERNLTTSVNDIDHIESNSYNGVAVVKVFFRPTVDVRTATAQITAASQTVLKQLPAGITPPQIINYNASTVPILQMALSSPELSEGRIFDLAQNNIRAALATVQGAAMPSPYGGRVRQIQIDIDPQALQAHQLSPADVGAALAAQNQIIPAGTARIGQFEYNVQLNNAPDAIEALNGLPVKTVNGSTIYMRDVAQVRDGSPPQQNEVRVDGKRSVLLTLLKVGNASTIDIVDNSRALMAKLRPTLPDSLKIDFLSDQSLFVKEAIGGVVREGLIAAALTSLMILLFLGSWRSTIIIATSIPLAILCAVIGLAVSGETLNIMTLGGLALAVGILVDEGTVTIENINWHLEQGKAVHEAIMDGAQQIVQPAFVSLLCICIAFVPMFFLGGVSGFLFSPMAKAVIFAMIASFLLSRTLVLAMAKWLLKPHAEAEIGAHHDALAGHPGSHNPLVRFQHGFEHRFEITRAWYVGVLTLALDHRRAFLTGFIALIAASFILVPFLGRDFFPAVDSGQINIHVRAPTGTKIEETAALFDQVEARIRQIVPASETQSIIDNIGMTVSGINLTYSNSGGIGPQDGDIMIALKEDHHPTAGYAARLRRELPQAFPGTSFSLLPADIVSQILNFGAPAPIDVIVSGNDIDANTAYANTLMARLSHISGIADLRIQQPRNYPQLNVDINRSLADRVGITENDVTRALSVDLAGSAQVAPTFWLNPKNGVSYPIVVQVPEYRANTISQLNNVSVTGSNGAYQTLGGLGTITEGRTAAVVTHYSISPAIDIYATPQGRDLGAVAGDIQRVLDQSKAELPKGASVTLRGQVQTMNAAFSGLIFGVAAAIVLIYLLIVVNFQSWIDPLVIISALPSALAGIVWMLFATHTTLSVPALTGAMMCMGVATANAVLVISFARERLAETGDGLRSALEAGATRFRPVLMTALAMIIGMAPMALGLGDGGEQNAPLGRAVIGGLIFATIATLVFVPVVFSLAHRKSTSASDAPVDGPDFQKETLHV